MATKFEPAPKENRLAVAAKQFASRCFALSFMTLTISVVLWGLTIGFCELLGRGCIWLDEALDVSEKRTTEPADHIEPIGPERK